MVDDWWQSAPGKIAAPPTLRWESGGGSVVIFPVYTVLPFDWYFVNSLLLVLHPNYFGSSHCPFRYRVSFLSGLNWTEMIDCLLIFSSSLMIDLDFGAVLIINLDLAGGLMVGIDLGAEPKFDFDLIDLDLEEGLVYDLDLGVWQDD